MNRVMKKDSIYAMSPDHTPVLKVKAGERVVFETYDCFTNQIQSSDDSFGTLNWDRINPASGPVYIEGAKAGDLLSVTIESIKTADQGVMVTGPGMGLLGDQLEENKIRMVPIENGMVHLSDSISVPVNKMIGVIGTAPAYEAISCGTPDLHGGNMDCKEIKEGATLLLPVHVDGALLALGDLHAAMADGEAAVCGVEVAGEVTVRLDLVKDKRIPAPMIITDTHVMTLSSNEKLDDAAQQAVVKMAAFLERELNFSKEDAISLVSVAGDLKVCQAVNPKKTARVELPLKYVNDKYDFITLIRGGKIRS
ncbi:acetamidase [Bacillus mangrovi]|uniref:Acetamidase n=1 Tax=Metabacillus mangrovi TaxID=1491830 RepID=A0A7X2V5S7_9BACI|nr:acetamidase/formamidase family protein [Metabacillus mangrovi]MTH54373.1 acetamidase [Metabacillus mangrovi]